jgi:hypothetical protein
LKVSWFLMKSSMTQLKIIRKAWSLNWIMKKAYDRVDWQFLEEMLVTRGFG